MKKMYIKSIACIVATVVFASSVFASLNVLAYEVKPEIENNINTVALDYDAYLSQHGDAHYVKSSIDIDLSLFDSNGANAVFNKNVLNCENGNVKFNFNVIEEGLYNIKFVWKATQSGIDPKIGIMIDNEYPFEAAEKIVLNRKWENVSEKPIIDAQGNEYAPEQKVIDTYITQLAKDDTGVALEPYCFYLTSGNHTLTICCNKQEISFSDISFCAAERVGSYDDISSSYKLSKIANAEPIIIQGEDADEKTTNAIIPKANNSDAGMTPCDASISKLNYIGSTSWQNPGETLTWKFTVKEAGYYHFNMRYKQSDLVNGDSLRWLRIDGVTPFEEAKTLRFPYNAKWKNFTFSNDKPYYIWLDAGDHTVSLEVTMGEWSEYFKRLSEIVDVLGDTYIQIVMITGESPDINRSYELFNQIPDFNDTLTDCYDKFTVLTEEMKAFVGERGTQCIAAIDNMARVLSSMLRSPYVAHHYVKDYYTNYASISSWLYEMKKMPLSVDEIQFIPYGSESAGKKVGFFSTLKFNIIRFISSFSQDYTLSEVTKSDSAIRLWVNWGQDQAAILNSLIKDSFTAQTGIEVKLEVVNASLINGILSNNFPDVALHMSRTEPVNLGVRGALYDLRNFDDCDEVLKRFQENAEIPYSYGEKLYALPDTQTFFMMFYRTDILKNLGLKIPETWDEFSYAATIIQRNNMNVYMPYTQMTTTNTVNAGIGSLNLFATLMIQQGLSLYNNELNATAIKNEKAINVFEKWTSYYTDYGYLKEADFYNRFRVGIMPLGIAPYSTYMTLYSSAPEISERWSIAPVPGSENGNNSVAGGGTGCAILEKSENKQEAWEFLKWWTSAETQERYTRNVESVLGMIGRTATSTVEAFKSLSWENDDLDTFLEAWNNVNEVPEVPGSYYLVRALDQAYWDVINGDSETKDAIIKWSKVADNEIERKIKEYS